MGGSVPINSFKLRVVKAIHECDCVIIAVDQAKGESVRFYPGDVVLASDLVCVGKLAVYPDESPLRG